MMPATTRSAIQTLVEQYIGPLVYSTGNPNPNQAPGGIVGVYINGVCYFFPFGFADLEKKTKPTENTIFGLGSVTKTFTTSILGQTPAQFGTAVAGSLPSGYKLTTQESGVTFDELATFTGGIIPSTPTTCDQPGLPACDQEQFVKFINGIAPARLPAPNVYSDSSIGLLGQSLMNRAGYSTFGCSEATAWYKAALLSFLSMGNTSHPPAVDANHPLACAYVYSTEKCEYLSTSYAPWVPWGTAGRMFSTASDMVNFIMANVGVGSVNGATVPAAVLQGCAQALLPRTHMGNPKSPNRQAFAWVVFPTDPLYGSNVRGKDGGLRGVSSYLAVNPTLQYGVVVLLNMQGVKVEGPTVKLMGALAALAGATPYNINCLGGDGQLFLAPSELGVDLSTSAASWDVFTVGSQAIQIVVQVGYLTYYLTPDVASARAVLLQAPFTWTTGSDITSKTHLSFVDAHKKTWHLDGNTDNGKVYLNPESNRSGANWQFNTPGQSTREDDLTGS